MAQYSHPGMDFLGLPGRRRRPGRPKKSMLDNWFPDGLAGRGMEKG